MLLRTAMNFPPPSASVFGGQHIRMLEATHARIPPTAPMMPGRPPAKPIIEKMELPHGCAAHEGVELADAYAVNVQCVRKTELPHDHSRTHDGASVPLLAVPPHVPRPRMSGAGAQDKAGDGEALGLIRLLGQIHVVFAHLGQRGWRYGELGQACNRQRRTSPPRLEQLIKGWMPGWNAREV